MICSFSNLDDKVLDAIKSLETKMGKSLLAFSCQDVKTSVLETAELEEVQALEKKLGLSLIAVNA